APSRSRAGHPGDALDADHLVLLEQEVDAAGVLVDDLAFPLLGAADVELRLADVDPEPPRLADLVEHGGGVEERLGRDATAVEAGAAELRVLFDHGDLEPQLTGADPGDIAARPAAEDDQVESFWGCVRHRGLPGGKNFAVESGISKDPVRGRIKRSRKRTPRSRPARPGSGRGG